ncbi:GerAB/ArcD/ProY family transporter [Priestia abyssalis]|uniref:GerAB/ArcD/ProY family transporter n=1 Tax=Priestia abyssalis TaxID=1221450 RepID=UPI001F3AC1EA|nr:endospore germination permease [Priestia abyssalis]
MENKMEGGKISASQLMVLTALFTVGTAVLIITSGLAQQAKQDAWIAAAIGNAIGLLLIFLYTTIGNLLPNMNLIEMMEAILGKWLGKTVAFFLIVTLFLGGPVGVLYYLGNFMRTQILNETPVEAIHILFGAIVIMGMRLGLETIARTAELLFPWFIFFFVVLICLSFPNIELKNVQPVFAGGLMPIWTGVLTFLSVAFLPDIVLLMFAPVYIQNANNARKSLLAGAIMGGMMLFMTIALSVLVLGADLTARNLYPTYVLAKKINIGNFLQRMEALIAIVWFISLYFRVTIYMYVVTLGIGQIFHLNDVRTLALPLGMILIVLSLIVSPNVNYMQTWVNETWIPYALSIGLFLPLLLLLVYAMRKKSIKAQYHKG